MVTRRYSHRTAWTPADVPGFDNFFRNSEVIFCNKLPYNIRTVIYVVYLIDYRRSCNLGEHFKKSNEIAVKPCH